MTAQIPMVFEIWHFLCFFILFFSSKNLDLKNLTELDFLNHIMGSYRGTLKGSKSSVQVRLLRSPWFSRYGVFYDFFVFFSKKLDIKKLTELESLNRIVGCYRVTLDGYKSSVQV